MRSPGGGARLVLMIGVLASCMSVSPAFARSPEAAVTPAPVASAPPTLAFELTRVATTAIDSGRFLVVETRAAILSVRHDSVVGVESRDSSTFVFRLTEGIERTRGSRSLHSTSLTRAEPPNRQRSRLHARPDSARVIATARNRLSYRV